MTITGVGAIERLLFGALAFVTLDYRCQLAIGGAEGDRTPDLRIANATLSQLSYGPIFMRQG